MHIYIFSTEPIFRIVIEYVAQMLFHSKLLHVLLDSAHLRAYYKSFVKHKLLKMTAKEDCLLNLHPHCQERSVKGLTYKYTNSEKHHSALSTAC